MTYSEVMANTTTDFWMMLWPLYLLIAGFVIGRFAKWLHPKR